MVDKLTDAMVQDLREMFDAFADDDGRIDRIALKGVLRALAMPATEAEVASMIGQVDADGSGTMDVDEFIQLICGPMDDAEPKEEVADAFKFLDRDQDGVLSVDDCEAACRQMDLQHLTREELDAALGEVTSGREPHCREEHIQTLMESNG